MSFEISCPLICHIVVTFGSIEGYIATSYFIITYAYGAEELSSFASLITHSGLVSES